MFASQLAATAAGIISAVQYSGDLLLRDRHQRQPRGRSQRDPVRARQRSATTASTRSNPTRLTTINQIGEYTTPKTHEIMFGIDHELMPNFGISGTFTYPSLRQLHLAPRIGVTSADYTQTGTLTGNAEPIGSFSTPFYAINASADSARRRPQLRGARWLPPALRRLRGQRRQADVEPLDGAVRVLDQQPSRVLRRRQTRSRIRRRRPSAPNNDGGIVVTQTGGSGKSNIFMVLPSTSSSRTGCSRPAGASTWARTGCCGRDTRFPTSAATCATGDVLRQQQERPGRGRCDAFPPPDRDLARRAHREGVQDQADEPDAGPRHLQHDQRVDRPGPAVPTCA